MKLKNIIISFVSLLKESYFIKYVFNKNKITSKIVKNIYFNYFSQYDFDNLLYKEWIKNNEPSKYDLCEQKKTLFNYQPLISIIVPTYNTNKLHLTEMIESVCNQTYNNWELCISDGNSKSDYIKQILTSYLVKDQRIKVIFLSKNSGIAENSNKSIELSKGDFLTFLDHDDLLPPFALFEVVQTINNNLDVDILYSDEDKLAEDGKGRFFPSFRTNFSIDIIRSVNYLCHLFVIKKSLGDSLGWFRKEFDGAQDYDLILRAIEKTNKIKHIAKILYHWRMHDESVASNKYAKEYAYKVGLKALYEHMNRSKISISTIELNNMVYRVHYPIEKESLVSIIIYSDITSSKKGCLKSILNITEYKNYEIIIISDKQINYEKRFSDFELSCDRVKIIIDNNALSQLTANNLAVQRTRGKYLLFLHNDVRIFRPDWLSNMLEFICRKDVGVVGSKLYCPNKKIQHAGLLITKQGTIVHPHPNFEKGDQRYWFDVNCIRNFSAVSGVCLLTRKDIFQEIGGFDERFNSTYMEVDYCLKVRQKNFIIVFTPYSELIHFGSIKHFPQTMEENSKIINEGELFKIKWSSFLDEGDPYYNPNLYVQEEDFILKDYKNVSNKL